MNTKIVPIGCAAICVALLYAIAIAAYAATITVININDSGSGSLRQALADANVPRLKSTSQNFKEKDNRK